jgi:hypothetical protein
VDSTPRAYRLKAGNAARKISTDAGDIPRTRGVRETLERLGVTVPEFPPYSPDLNLVEQPIGKLKAFLRKLGPRSWRSLVLLKTIDRAMVVLFVWNLPISDSVSSGRVRPSRHLRARPAISWLPGGRWCCCYGAELQGRAGFGGAT